jgi:ASPM-SPD-2-Hydin domain-containing protein/HYDIN/CFA65/VesB family protein
MSRMGNRSIARTRTARFGGALGALLAAASVVAVAPAGASSQDVHFSLTPIFFGSVVLGTSTTGQSIVTNNSGLPLYFVSASPSGAHGAEYHASQGTCTGALAPGATCNVAVVFQPNAKGLRASTLTVRFAEHNAQGKVTKAASKDTALRGHGTPPTFTLSDANAGNVALKQIGTASAMITNTSTVPLTLRGVHLSNDVGNDFRVSATTCPSPVLPGGSCSIVVSFRPHRLGGAAATLKASMLVQGTRASLVARQASVLGTGVTVSGKMPPFELSALDFGQVTVGTTATGSVVLTNTSSKNETFASDVILANASNAYAVTGNTCPTPIAPAGTCQFTVTYAPAAAVTHNATLVVRVTALNAHGVTVTLAAQTSLTGKGANPTFTLSSSGFPTTTVGATSDGTETVTNTSLVPLSYASTSFQGADQSSWSQVGNACGGSIAPAGTCTLEIAFSPHIQGTQAITIEVTLDLTVRSHTQDVSLRDALVGHATLPTITLGAPTLASTPKGVAVTGQATLTNSSNVSLSYDGFGVSGANPSDFTVTGTTCSGLLAPSATCDLTVQFDPSGSSPGTEHASLKVIVAIAGITPTLTTSDNVQLTGTES